MPSPSDKKIEIWLPTGETHVRVSEGEVTIWDDMTMKRKIIQKPAGFVRKEEDRAVVDPSA